MATANWTRIGYYSEPTDPYAAHFREVIDYSGISIEKIDVLSTRTLAELEVIVLCGYGAVSDALKGAVSQWVSGGGKLVCCGSTWGLADVLGLDSEMTRVSTGQVSAPSSHRLWPEEARAVRFFGGNVGGAAGATVVASCNGKAAVTKHELGTGCAWFIGPHVGQTFFQMQVGRSVEGDGIGASDGTAPIDDGKLRAEDGATLEFSTDRTTAADGEIPFFGQAHSDIIKEIFIRAIIEAAEAQGGYLLMLGPWPKSAEMVTTMTVESDTFDATPASKIQRSLSMYGLLPAWLIPTPSFPQDAYRIMRSWEFEFGMQYSEEAAGGWQADKLKIQYIALSRSTGIAQLTTLRPAGGKWKGLLEFYESAEQAGAKLSVSKGGRYPGTSGFLFGTSQPYYPCRKEGQAYGIMEAPYQILNPGLVTPDEAIEPIFAEVLRRNGCLQVVVEPSWIDTPNAMSSLHRFVSLTKQSRGAFLKPEQVAGFVRARRGTKVDLRFGAAPVSVGLQSDLGIKGLTLHILGPEAEISSKGSRVGSRQIERYGATFQTFELDIDHKGSVEVRLLPAQKKPEAA